MCPSRSVSKYSTTVRHRRRGGTDTQTMLRDVSGISPGHYLRLRRLKVARAAMLRSEPATARVEEVARRHGFTSSSGLPRHTVSHSAKVPRQHWRA